MKFKFLFCEKKVHLASSRLIFNKFHFHENLLFFWSIVKWEISRVSDIILFNVIIFINNIVSDFYPECFNLIKLNNIRIVIKWNFKRGMGIVACDEKPTMVAESGFCLESEVVERRRCRVAFSENVMRKDSRSLKLSQIQPSTVCIPTEIKNNISQSLQYLKTTRMTSLLSSLLKSTKDIIKLMPSSSGTGWGSRP